MEKERKKKKRDPLTLLYVIKGQTNNSIGVCQCDCLTWLLTHLNIIPSACWRSTNKIVTVMRLKQQHRFICWLLMPGVWRVRFVKFPGLFLRLFSSGDKSSLTPCTLVLHPLILKALIWFTCPRLAVPPLSVAFICLNVHYYYFFALLSLLF